ncbi:tyrosine-type recombinase/integrase [uncultured Jannaschia sp.]|uniref:tyrosine-type recombinase/integrase n=1 Tax=uncultured Jannaschia sp. TaxID=293347 RepID=UPI002609A3BD|nr:tyrosine-type recombinase/integrase [uncultured Jannaschia sp.]
MPEWRSGDDRAAHAHGRALDYLGQPDVGRLLVAAKKSRHGIRDHLLTLMIFRHGIRISEAVALHRQDVGLAHSRSWIARLEDGLSGEQPVAGDKLRAIRRWPAQREDALPSLFVSERKELLIRQAVNCIIGAASTRASLGRVRPYMLRHSCGFALANKGRDLRLRNARKLVMP